VSSYHPAVASRPRNHAIARRAKKAIARLRDPVVHEAMSYEFRRFVPSYEALGILLDFLVLAPPFDGMRAGKLLPALRHQIANGHHIAAFRGETLVGYAGWLPITEAMGEAWRRGAGELAPAEPGTDDAVALTTVRTEEPAVLLPLIRACRKQEPGKRVYINRDYTESARPQRRNAVLNRTSAARA
jgi:hypothetical protein